MTTGTWTPASEQPQTPDEEAFMQAAGLGRQEADLFPDHEQPAVAVFRAWMKRGEDDWRPLLEGQPTDRLRELAGFFTLAEHLWEGWQGGERNPVVWICRELKRRDAFPDVDLTRWIKANTDNRYLPYGNPLA